MKPRSIAIAALGTGLAAGIMAAATPAAAASTYAIVKTVPLGTPDRWDYVVFDPTSGRVYIAHGDQLSVVDGRSGASVGKVAGITGGTHGTAISTATGKGFTDDGENGTAVAFDLKTLEITRRIPAAADADAIVLDKASGHVFVIEGDPGTITVIDPRSAAAIATITAGEKMEYAAADDAGTIYVAGEAKSDILKVDAKTNAIVARWSTPDCASPHGLALDKAGHRLFMGCVNSLMEVVDADTGRVVTRLPIGRGSDAVAWDANRKRVFSSNGADGTITIYQQTAPDAYRALEPVRTAISGRTMAVDPASGRLFVAAAETDPSPTRGGRAKPRPGTLRLLMLDPTE